MSGVIAPIQTSDIQKSPHSAICCACVHACSVRSCRQKSTKEIRPGAGRSWQELDTACQPLRLTGGVRSIDCPACVSLRPYPSPVTTNVTSRWDGPPLQPTTPPLGASIRQECHRRPSTPNKPQQPQQGHSSSRSLHKTHRLPIQPHATPCDPCITTPYNPSWIPGPHFSYLCAAQRLILDPITLLHLSLGATGRQASTSPPAIMFDLFAMLLSYV